MVFNNLKKLIRAVIKPFLVVSLVLLLTSCSQTKLAYGFLDNWIRWQIDDYVDLNSEQSQILKAESKKFHRWHRDHELFRYSLFLNETISTLENPHVQEPTVAETFERVDQFIKSSTAQLHQPTIELVSSLNTEQVEDILKKVKKDEDELREKLSEQTFEERKVDQLKKTKKTFKRYIGSLTDEQEQLIENMFKQGQSNLTHVVQRQENWRTEFAELMQKDLKQPENQQTIIRLFYDYPEFVNEEHRQASEHNTKLFYQLIVDVHASLTDKQKDKLIKKIANYRDDFLELAGESSESLILKAEI